jgi:hypothetical protein
MKPDRTYSRVAFPPADDCALGPVTVYAADGKTKIGFIPVEKLRKRKSAVQAQRSPEITPRDHVAPQVPMVRAKSRAGRP